MNFLSYLCIGAIVIAPNVDSFPNGAPIEACIYDNNPNHPSTRSLPPRTSPYEVTASDNTYSLGSTITVRIRGPPFKGFFVQARHGGPTGKWMGSWVEERYNKVYEECSAVTHVSPEYKEDVILTWKAPFDKSGKVVFLATVLESYDKYWSNQLADVLPSRGRHHF